MIPLKVYVETNRDIVFDFTGKKSVYTFHKYVVEPTIKKRIKYGFQNVVTRCYFEENLLNLFPTFATTEAKIERAR